MDFEKSFQPFETFEPCDAVNYPEPREWKHRAFRFLSPQDPRFATPVHAVHWDYSFREVEGQGDHKAPFMHHRKTHVVFQIVMPKDGQAAAELIAYYVYSCGNRPSPSQRELEELAHGALLHSYIKTTQAENAPA